LKSAGPYLVKWDELTVARRAQRHAERRLAELRVQHDALPSAHHVRRRRHCRVAFALSRARLVHLEAALLLTRRLALALGGDGCARLDGREHVRQREGTQVVQPHGHVHAHVVRRVQRVAVVLQPQLLWGRNKAKNHHVSFGKSPTRASGSVFQRVWVLV